MTLFNAYYDASGSESELNAGLTVVGLVSTEAKWLKFERAWESVLTDFNVAAHHMKHFTGSSPKSDFATWAGDETKRSAYFKALILTLKRGMHKAFAVSIEPGVLDAVNQELQFGYSGYALAANLCRRHAENWVKRKHPGATLAHVFEHGDTGQKTLRDLKAFSDILSGLRFPFSVVPKKDAAGKRFRQFEAADMVAWEARRMVLDRLSQRAPRGSLREIARMLPVAGTTLKADAILAICRERPDIYPPRA